MGRYQRVPVVAGVFTVLALLMLQRHFAPDDAGEAHAAALAEQRARVDAATRETAAELAGLRARLEKGRSEAEAAAETAG